MLSGMAVAAPVYQPPGTALTYGNVSFGQRTSSPVGNPAANISDLDRRGGEAKTIMGLSVSAGIEYGNVQDILDLIDSLSGNIEPSDPDDGGEPPPGGDPGDKPPDGGIDFPIDPDTEELIKDIASEVAIQTALLTLLQAEGYAKGFVALDIPISLGKQYLGGAWAFGINLSGTSSALGFAESIEFDTEEATADFETVLMDIENGTVQERYNIGGDDVVIEVSPDAESIKIRFDNDSTLVTKAAVINEFAGSYSREIPLDTSSGKLYGGVNAKFYRVGLSRVATRFGDITDSEEIWRSIKDADFNYSNDIGIDFGLLWSGNNYQLGATLTNINEPDFAYPDLDASNYKDPGVRDIIARGENYVMERQLKLEASWFTQKGSWGWNFGIDANKVRDPLGFDYQWVTLSGGYNTESFWLPGVRVGVRSNLAGTRLSYIGGGVTAFKYVDLDIATSLETTRINDTKLPRSLLINLGFNVAF